MLPAWLSVLAASGSIPERIVPLAMAILLYALKFLGWGFLGSALDGKTPGPVARCVSDSTAYLKAVNARIHVAGEKRKPDIRNYLPVCLTVGWWLM